MTGRTPDHPRHDGRRWLLLDMAAPPAGEAFLMVDALHRLGARSVEREASRVVALFPPRPDPASLAAEVRVAIRASTSLTDPAVRWRRVAADSPAAPGAPDPAPRRVSDRIVVVAATTPPGGPPSARPDDATAPSHAAADVVVRLEPSTAFGTAEHPTTRACLRALDGLVAAGDRVLDVGAGSAILAIAAVLLGADRADALEADPIACAAARRNIALNQVGGRVRLRQVRVTPGSLGRPGRHDGVVANLQADLLLPLIPDLAAATRHGWLVLSGPLRSERDAIVRSAETAGLTVNAEEIDDGWWTGRLSR